MRLNPSVRLICSLVAAACLTSSARAAAPPRKPTIWVLSNGFHSAIALRTADAPAALRKALEPAPSNWILVGWGDRDFFMARPVTPWIALKAICWPTPSALHVVPLKSPPQAIYRNSEVIEVEVTRDGLRALQQYISKRVAVDAEGAPIELGAGYSPGSIFVLGNEKFYFPKMCNWWVTAGLRAGGLRVSPVQTISAQALMVRLRKVGKRVGGLRRKADAF